MSVKREDIALLHDAALAKSSLEGYVQRPSFNAAGRVIMAGKAVPKMKGVRVFPPPPEGFDALGATRRDLLRHGIPQRPDPNKQPGMAALWEQYARRHQNFEHLEPEFLPADKPTEIATVKAGIGLFPGDSCGYELTSIGAPFVMLSGTWTVPNLNFSPGPVDPVQFRTFFGLGFLDVHVEMTVDSSQNVTALIRIHTGALVALPVSPGDAISAVLCQQTDPLEGFYFLANETTSQTVNFNIATPEFPGPAVKINAGISRGTFVPPPGANPLARFGVVYFDEIAAFTTSGTRFLTDGVATTMINEPFGDGSTLAQPQRLNDFAFKAVYRGD